MIIILCIIIVRRNILNMFDRVWGVIMFCTLYLKAIFFIFDLKVSNMIFLSTD